MVHQRESKGEDQKGKKIKKPSSEKKPEDAATDGNDVENDSESGSICTTGGGYHLLKLHYSALKTAKRNFKRWFKAPDGGE